MRAIIYGAGAVGSVLGARLHQGGVETVLVGRPAHVKAINEQGLLLRTADEETRIRVSAIANLDEIEPRADDIMLITAKTQDTPTIHDAIAAWSPNIAVVCATNGVEHERMALRRFERVYAMVIMLPAQFEKAGEVTALCLPTHAVVDIGCYPSGVDDLARQFAAAADQSPHVRCEADPDIMAKKYAKIVLNLGNAAEAAVGLGGRSAPVVTAAQAEAKAVYAAAGIRTIDDANDETMRSYRERTATMAFKIPTGASFLGGSTWQGLAKGATTVETDYFNGEIVLLGRLHGVATPHNLFLQRVAHELVRERRAPASMTAEQLDERWKHATGVMSPS